MLSARTCVLSVLAALLGWACSSGDDVSRNDGIGGATSGGSGGTSGSGASDGSGGSAATGGSAASPGSGGGGGVILDIPGPDGGLQGCTATAVEAPLRPVLLAVMLDRSGSMACGPKVCGTKGAANNTANRWTPVTSALKAFYADEGSAGLSASMTFFPLTKPVEGVVCGTAQCDAAEYGTPSVPMTALPEPTLFANAIDANFPACHEGTPMITAFEGAVPYFQGLAANDPLAHVAIVLVTDVTTGEPYESCKDMQGQPALDAVAQQLANIAATIPTYVIGVGSVTALQQLAQAGGTETAYLVSITDPAKTQTEFLATINLMRRAAVPCDVTIPAPPKGETLDPNLVNLTFTPPTGGDPVLFSMSADCTSEESWRYDNPDAPTRIELCPSTCDSVKAQYGGRIDVAFGCKTFLK
jgi:hypothetical protein